MKKHSLKEKIKKLKNKLRPKNKKKTLNVPRVWNPQKTVEPVQPESMVIQIELEKKRLSLKTPGRKTLLKWTSGIFIILNALMGIFCLFGIVFLAVFFFINSWLIIHVYKSSRRKTLDGY